MRILLIEDDTFTAQGISMMLKTEGFSICTSTLGEDGLEMARAYDFDLILLDIGLPDMSGVDVLRALRSARVVTPVMMISGTIETASKVRTLGLGADDYVTKPIDKAELVARIHAVVRRSQGHAESIIQTGDIAVNVNARTVEVRGEAVHLTGKEYEILELLSLRKDTTLTKDVILNHLYGGRDEPDPKIVDVFVCKLRKKLAAPTRGRQHIQTVWGRGYMLREPGALQAAA
jgi:two-component system cell cycle response regulator CtrA